MALFKGSYFHESRHERHDSLLERRNGARAAERTLRSQSIVCLAHRPRGTRCKWLFGLLGTCLGLLARACFFSHGLGEPSQIICGTAVVLRIRSRSLARLCGCGEETFLPLGVLFFCLSDCFVPVFLFVFAIIFFLSLRDCFRSPVDLPFLFHCNLRTLTGNVKIYTLHRWIVLGGGVVFYLRRMMGAGRGTRVPAMVGA